MSAESTLNLFRNFWAGTGTGPLISICNEQEYRQNPDFERMVDVAADCIRADEATGENIVPVFNPDFGTVSIPAIWGGRRVPASKGGGIYIEPIAHSVSDLEHLAPPAAFEESDFNVALSLHRKVCERVESDGVYLRTPDLQGPMNTLGLLMEQTELLVALYEEPDLIHRTLTHITDVTIDYLRRYRAAAGKERVIGNVWPWVILPDGQGIGITQDFLPLLGPDLYAEFELPQLKRFADEFGGVFIHCCGQFAQHLPTLAKADFKIWGIEVHYPCTKLWEVQEALGNSLGYLPCIAPTGHAEFPSILAFLRALKQHACDETRILLCIARQWLTPEEHAELKAWAGRDRSDSGGEGRRSDP